MDCRKKGPKGFGCSLEKGHSGDHAAGGPHGRVYETWPQEETAEVVEPKKVLTFGDYEQKAKEELISDAQVDIGRIIKDSLKSIGEARTTLAALEKRHAELMALEVDETLAAKVASWGADRGAGRAYRDEILMLTKGIE